MNYIIISAPSLILSSSSSPPMFHTHPLDIHEIRSRIAGNLGPQDLASCTRVSHDWNDSFTPRLYHSIVLSKHGPPMESVNRNKRFILHLAIMNSACEKLSKCARGKMISTILANLAITTLNLKNNHIGDDGAQALADGLKANSTLTTLNLGHSSIGDNGVRVLSEAHIGDCSRWITSQSICKRAVRIRFHVLSLSPWVALKGYGRLWSSF